MGKPGGARAPSSRRKTEANPRELKHLSTSEEEKSTEMPRVAASEIGQSPNRPPCGVGVVGPTDGQLTKPAEVPWNGAPETVRAR